MYYKTTSRRNEIGLKAYKSKPDDYLKNMNLNNKRNLSNKEIKQNI